MCDIEETFAAAISAQENLAVANRAVADTCSGYLRDLLSTCMPNEHIDEIFTTAGFTLGRYERTVDGNVVKMTVVPTGTERKSRSFETETIHRMISIGSLMIEAVKLAFSILSRSSSLLANLRLCVIKNVGDLYFEQYPTVCLALL
jgi:hypothetical protein